MNQLRFVNALMTASLVTCMFCQSCLADQKAGKDISAGKTLSVGKDLKVGKDLQAGKDAKAGKDVNVGKDLKVGKDLNAGKHLNTGAKPLGLGNCPNEMGGTTSGNKDEDDYDKMRKDLNDFVKNDAFKDPKRSSQADRDAINHRKEAMDKHPGRHLHKANEYDTKGTYY